MKKIAVPILLSALTFAMTACHNESDSAAIQQLQDSLFAKYPNKVGAIHINSDNREKLIVTLGSPALYELSQDEMQKQAVEIGVMAVRFFGKESYLKTGRLVLTRDLTNKVDDPADGKSTDMKIDSLIAAGLMK